MAKRKIGKENVTKKLMSFMKMFAEVKGMKHLYCYSTLQVIFISYHFCRILIFTFQNFPSHVSLILSSNMHILHLMQSTSM